MTPSGPSTPPNTALDDALKASGLMLAALLSAQDDYREQLRSGPGNDEADEIDAMLSTIDDAIARAQARGITRPTPTAASLVTVGRCECGAKRGDPHLPALPSRQQRST